MLTGAADAIRAGISLKPDAIERRNQTHLEQQGSEAAVDWGIGVAAGTELGVEQAMALALAGPDSD